MCIAERDAHVSAVHADHEARGAQDEITAARHRQFASTWRALEAKAATEAGMFAAAQATRQDWETVTETTRRIAIAADTELRRRHPDRRPDPLRPHPAEAEHINRPAAAGQQETWFQPALDGPAHSASDADDAARQQDSAPESDHDERVRLALGLTRETVNAEIPDDVRRIHENAQLTRHGRSRH